GRRRGSGQAGGVRGRTLARTRGARGSGAARRRPRLAVHVAGDGPRAPAGSRCGAVMHVAIDVSPLVQTRAGTARYLKGLLRELRRRRDVEVSTRSFGRGDRLSTLARDGVWYPFLLGWEQGADVLHCPTYRGPVRPRVPLVLTVHDLAVLRQPEAFNRWTRAYSPRVVPRVLRAARRVIAVSEFTRCELVELLGVPEDRIHVVPSAVEDEFTQDGPAEQG